MAAFMLTWNSDPENWTERADQLLRVNRGDEVEFHWLTGHTRKIRSGDRVFLLKQGEDPRGIIGAGFARRDSRPYDPDTVSRRRTDIVCKMDRLLDHEIESILELPALRQIGIGEPIINAQSSGNEIPPELVARLEAIWDLHLRSL